MTEFIFRSNPRLLPVVMLLLPGLAIELPYRFVGTHSRIDRKTDPLQNQVFSMVEMGDSSPTLCSSCKESESIFKLRLGIATQD